MPRCDPRSDHVGFVAYKVALWQGPPLPSECFFLFFLCQYYFISAPYPSLSRRCSYQEEDEVWRHSNKAMLFDIGGTLGLTSTFSLFFRLSFSFPCQWNRLFHMKRNRHDSLRVTSVRFHKQSDCLTLRFACLKASSRYVAGRCCGRPASWFKVFGTFAQPPHQMLGWYAISALRCIPSPAPALSQFPSNEALRS